MQPWREKVWKRGGFEANWAVRNASICPLPYKADSCKVDTSGHLIMQIPKVRWPLQPQGMLSPITRIYTGGHVGLKRNVLRIQYPRHTTDIFPFHIFSLAVRKLYFSMFFFSPFDIYIFPICSVHLY